MEKEISYEDASKELNEIINRLEEGEVPMSEALELFEKGKNLVKVCYSHLDKAKGKLTEIKESIEGLEEI